MDAINIDKTTLDAVVEYGKQLAFPGTPITGEKVHYAVLPLSAGGFSIESLEEFQFPQGIPPERIVAAPQFHDAVSFCEYLKAFKDERLRIFADANRVLFHAVLDYHTPQDPEFCQHTASLPLTYSPQWNIWVGSNDKWMTQADFAEFLEDNYRDIQQIEASGGKTSPSAATMLEVAKELNLRNEVTFESKVCLKDNTRQFRFSEDMKTTGTMNAPPDLFTIKIPVFFGEPSVCIDCRLRYAISGGKLTFKYKLYRPIETKMEAFRAAVTAVAGILEMDVHLGVFAGK